jgi:hypothetical protein
MDAHRLVALQFVNRITKKKKAERKTKGHLLGSRRPIQFRYLKFHYNNTTTIKKNTKSTLFLRPERGLRFGSMLGETGGGLDCCQEFSEKRRNTLVTRTTCVMRTSLWILSNAMRLIMVSAAPLGGSDTFVPYASGEGDCRATRQSDQTDMESRDSRKWEHALREGALVGKRSGRGRARCSGWGI